MAQQHDHDTPAGHDHRGQDHDHGHDHGHRHDHGHDHAHDHGHGHGIGHHDHDHAVTGGNARRVALVLVLTAAYAGVQVAGGLMSGSLALIADAGHMVSDAAALALALVAYRMARRPATPAASYGHHRVRVLAALANGAVLLLLTGWILWEAVARLVAPVAVLAGPMLVVAVIGMAVNLGGFLILRTGAQEDANLRGALLHVLGDLLGSVGAIAAALGIMATGWTLLDPILSVLVAVLILRSAWALVAGALQVLLQATPAGIDPAQVLADIATLPGVAGAAHLHVWTLADTRRVATVHVSPAPGADALALPGAVARRLAGAHGIAHATVEVNPPGALRDAARGC